MKLELEMNLTERGKWEPQNLAEGNTHVLLVTHAAIFTLVYTALFTCPLRLCAILPLCGCH